MNLDGAGVLVTGATGGIGNAIARELAAHGARLVITGRRTEVLEPLAAELGARALAVDLADPQQLRRLIDEVSDVDVLVANAALPGSGALASFSVEEIDFALDVNLRAPIMLAHTLSPRMVERGRGHLVFISSLAGKAGSASSSVYSATKFGLRGFSLALRAELRAHGVGVSTVFPGFIRDAGMFADSGVKLPPGVGTRAPQEVARAVVRAIERNKAEIDVAPVPLRAGAAFAGVAPELAATLQRMIGGDRVADSIGEGQRDKRS